MTAFPTPTLEEVADYLARETVPVGFTVEQMGDFALIDAFGRIGIVPNAHGTQFPLELLEGEEGSEMAGRFVLVEDVLDFTIVKAGVNDRVFKNSSQLPFPVVTKADRFLAGCSWAPRSTSQSLSASIAVRLIIEASRIAHGFYQAQGLDESEISAFSPEEQAALKRMSSWYENFEWESRGA